jgi:LPS export ABC transporter protein LptC
MSNHRRYLYPIMVLVATAALGWWLVREPEPQQQTLDTGGDKQSPQYYATDATLRAYTVGGALDARVTGQRFEYFGPPDRWHMIEPRWRRLPNEEGGRSWRGRARRGRLSNDETRGRLSGDVVLTTPGQHGPIRVYTQRLWLYFPRDYADTQEHVRIEAPHWQHTGTGGRFWIAQERFSLLSDTEATYDKH